VLTDDPFVVGKTIDINCKNKEGFTALQIVMSKLLGSKEEEARKESIEKVDTLLGIGADLTVVKSGTLQAVLCFFKNKGMARGKYNKKYNK
jgi:hypothetical protein